MAGSHQGATNRFQKSAAHRPNRRTRNHRSNIPTPCTAAPEISPTSNRRLPKRPMPQPRGITEKTGVLKDETRITTWIAKKRYLNRHDAIPQQPGAQLKIYKDKQ